MNIRTAGVFVIELHAYNERPVRGVIVKTNMLEMDDDDSQKEDYGTVPAAV